MKGPASLLLVVVGVFAVAAVAYLLLDEQPGDPTAAAPVVAEQPDAPALKGNAVAGAEAEATRLATTPVTGAARSALAAPDTGEGVATLAAPADKPRVTLVGRVVDDAGRAVADARLVYHGSDRGRLMVALGEDTSGIPARPETLSGRDGSFRLEMDLPESSADDRMLVGSSPAGQVVVSHDAFAALAKECPSLSAGAEVPLGTLVLAQGASLSGRVVDEAGRPVANARVSASNPAELGARGRLAMLLGSFAIEAYTATTSGVDGRFLIRGLRAGPASLSAEADGYQVGHLDDLLLEAGLTHPVGEVVLPLGAELAGVVLDEAGKPVAGALVRVSSFSRLVITNQDDMPRHQLGNEMRLRAVTADDGSWHLAGIGPGQYTVHASAEGFGNLDRPNVEAGVLDLVLRLSRLGGLLVTLHAAPDQALVSGAKVEARPGREFPFGPEFQQALTVLAGDEARAAAGVEDAPEGLYYIKGAGAKGTRLTIAAPGFAIAEVDGPSVSSGELGRLDVQLLPEAVLAGRVLDTAGAAVPGARVTVSEYVAPPTMDTGRIEIRRTMTLGGSGDGPVWNKTVADADGAFEVRGVPAGDWEIEAAADDFASQEPLVVTLSEGQSQRDLAVQLVAAGRIAGLVLEEDGLPASAAEVSVKPLAERAGAGIDPRAAHLAALLGNSDERRVSCDGEGRFELGELLPGLYEVQLVRQQGVAMGGAMIFVGGNDQPGGPTEVVEVLAAQTSQVQLVRPPTARLTGRVIAGGKAVPDTTVTLTESGAFMLFGGQRATTDSSGRYEFSGVEPGDYEISAQVAGAALPEKAKLTLEAGLEERHDLVFSGVTLSGRVVDVDTGEGVEGVTVNVSKTSGAGGAPEPATRAVFAVTMMAGPGGGGSGMTMELGGDDLSKVATDGEGRFVVRWLKPGRYGIQTTGGGYARAEGGPYEVDGDDVVDGVILEAVKGATLTGRVISGETGDLLDGVPVSLASRSGGSREMGVTEGGSYSFEGLAAGDYDITVMGSGFGGGPIAQDVVSLERGEARVLDLTTSAEAASGGGLSFQWGGPGEGEELELFHGDGN